jgi:hypothetical protein
MNAQSKMVAMVEEERRAQRQTLIWKGVLHLGNQKTDVRVRNISAKGAMIESPTTMEVGSEPVLQLSEAVSIPARVAWTTSGQMGVKFHDEFDLALLAQTRPIIAKSTWSPPDSAIQAAWERRLRRLSPAQLRAEFKGYITD